MTIVGHIWAVITNLIATAIVLAMFSRATGSFETIVIAGLTLIYVSVISSTMLLGKTHLEFGQMSAKQFARIAHLLNDSEASNYDEQLKEGAINNKKITVRFYINASFNLLLWVIAVVNLLTAL